ncbi:hypothetical protein CMU41_19660 [Elizabethkingia anophelis]|nr:hypothetical protein [Elizabethkingia anophelis]MDV3767833.1 hypothetical protein [Elizabethkingia anophelis]MDV3775607.1 hypothetical protein [Elizabethkingia anophelis]MDV3787018.1 hypothetical protein [Elizabethkingia anophelis]MDV3839750.1 hypothetical protein [Elizabethkingia anophelis]
MKTLLLSISFVLFSGLAFGQKLTEKKAYQMFVKSNVSKALKLNKTDFKNYYKEGLLTDESLILNSLNPKELKELIAYEKCTDESIKKSGIGMPTQMEWSYKEYKRNQYNPKCK